MEYREGRSEKASKLHELSRAQRQKEHNASLNLFSFEKGISDDWGERGEDSKWCRLHRTPRRAMFTPFKIPRGPGRKTRLKSVRITEGINELGQSFRIVDDWMDPTQAHKLLDKMWVGKTFFDVNRDEDVSMGGDYRRQRDRAHASSVAPILKGNDEPKTPRVSWADLQDSDGSSS